MPGASAIPDHLEELAPLLPSLRKTSEPVPASWDGMVQQAVQLKRSGQYAEASAIYLMITKQTGALYTSLVLSWYKTVVSAGYLSEAQGLLGVGDQIYEVSPPSFGGLTGIDWTSSFVEHYGQLKDALDSLPELEAYLRPLSGNPDYRFPRDFDTEVARVSAVRAEAQRRTEQAAGAAPSAEPSSTSGGGRSACYVATAVYGSYDAPQMLTLRKFRDQRLARSLWGRGFIRFYYAVSPGLVKVVKPASMLGRFTRSVLDRLVRRVDLMGLDDRRPYRD